MTLMLIVHYIYSFPVGGGTAGCVLANRLSQDPETTVLLIEAGESKAIAGTEAVPAASVLLQGTSEDWKYLTVPQKHSCLELKKNVRLCNAIFIIYNFVKA